MQARYVDPADGSTYPVERPLWRSPAGGYLNLTPGAGLRRGDIDPSCRSVWRYAAAIRVERSHAVSMGEGWTPLIPARWDGVPVLAKLAQIAPDEQSGVVAVVEHDAHGVIADRLEPQDGHVLLAGSA